MIRRTFISKPNDGYLAGTIDMHVHSGQDHVERLMTDEQVIQTALQSGMRGLVLKSHTRCTLDGCNEAQQRLGIQNAAFGSMVLHSWQQAEDITTIRSIIADGLKLLYMPTVMSGNSLNPIRLDGQRMNLMEDGRLKPIIVKVLEVAIRGGCTVATGHADSIECLAILDCCRELGASTVLITHPEYWVTDMSDDQQEWIAKEYPNALFERTLYSILNEEEARRKPGTLAIVSEKLARVVDNIQRIGPKKTILSSDLGQTWNYAPTEGFSLFLEMIASTGISPEDIRRMTLVNPCRALGLYNEMIQCEVELALSEAKDRFQTPFHEPLLGFADADNPAFAKLKQVVGSQHVLPCDVLAGARSVVSVFLPFGRQVVEGNSSGSSPSTQWCHAYTEGNQCLDVLSTAAAESIRRCGYKAEIHRGSHHLTNLHEPDVDLSLLTSSWSQRHVARICGLGTFGVNNLLITRKGSAGRFASLVTDMPLAALPIETKERCLGKQSNGTKCLKCIQRCPAGAISRDGFDRLACWNYLVANNHVSQNAGLPIVNVCGKCSSGVPCSRLGRSIQKGARI